jgi:hypothetical protein
MTDALTEPPSGNYAATKVYAQQTARPEAFMVEDAQWKRIRRRIGEIESTHAPEWLLTIASIAIGIAASAAIAYVVLPKATKHSADLAAGVRPSLISAAIAGLLVGVVLGGEYLRQRRRQAVEKTDLQDEMDTIRRAWGQSGQAP